MPKADQGLAVEVAYATPERQLVLRLTLPVGTSLSEAVQCSGLLEAFPELAADALRLGVFGRLERRPNERLLQGGERIEVYRPLLADPKEARKQRAIK